jgi:hypothetical protein
VRLHQVSLLASVMARWCLSVGASQVRGAGFNVHHQIKPSLPSRAVGKLCGTGLGSASAVSG